MKEKVMLNSGFGMSFTFSTSFSPSLRGRGGKLIKPLIPVPVEAAPNSLATEP